MVVVRTDVTMVVTEVGAIVVVVVSVVNVDT